MVPFLFDIEQNLSFFKLKCQMDYFSRKSLSKYLMNTIEINKHDVDIFINGTWQKYVGN
jgi:hypothetical protein